MATSEWYRLWRYLVWTLFGGLLLYAALVDLDVYPIFYGLAALGVVALIVRLTAGQTTILPDGILVYWLFPLVMLVSWMLVTGYLRIGFNFDKRYEVELMYSYLLLPWIAAALWYSRLDSQMLFKIVIVASLYAVPYDIAACIKQDPRGMGAMSIPIIRGNMGMLLGLMALTALCGVRGRLWQWLAAAGFVGGVYLSILSGSRGGWIALATALPLVFWFVRRNTPSRQGILVAAVFVLVLLVMFCPNPLVERIIKTLHSLWGYLIEDEYRTSLGWRFVMWKAACWGFLQHPFSGWGLGSFWDIFKGYIQTYDIPFNEPFYFHRPHNEYLQFLSEGGVPAFLLYLCIYGMPLLFLWRYRQVLANSSLEIKTTALMLFVVVEAVAEFAISFLSLISIMIGLSYVVMISALLSVLVRYLGEEKWKT